MNDIAIKTVNLTKSFGENVAVNNINLEIKKGELFGLVGPDGAGKTTTMRLLTGIMMPSSGDAFVAGHSIVNEDEKIKEKIGYMSQRFGLYEDLTVMENLIFYADLYDVPQSDRPHRIEKLLGFSNLAPFKNRLAGKLSGGMKQKLGLACALIHIPEILFLDEPTNGVDPVSRRDFWKILYGLLKEGITIFLSTAYLDEAERCTRIGLINKGNLLIVEEPAQVKKSIKIPMIEIWVSDARTASSIIKEIEGVKNVNIYGDHIHIAFDNKIVLANTITEKVKSNEIEVKSQREILPSLEDIFIYMV